jgi:DNA-binding NarL/FixJ family response regulator
MRTLVGVDRRPMPASPVRPLVLLAIDDEARRATYAYALSASGFEVAIDANPVLHRDDASADRPDIIVADVSPESRRGWGFVQKLKRDRRTADIAVIAMAMDAGVGACQRARREGCAAVCRRACPPDVLASGIRAVLGSRQ